jgi:hypothetical protein
MILTKPGGMGCSRRHSGQRNERARGSTRLVKHGVKQNVCIHGKSFGVRNLSKQIGHVVRRSICVELLSPAVAIIS